MHKRNYLMPSFPCFEDEGGDGGGQGAGGTYAPPATQADLDRIVEQRLSRERAKFAGHDDFKAKAAKFDEIEAKNATDTEKAVTAAREEERAKARGEATPRVVRAEFKAEAKGVLSADQLDALLEDLDLSKYVDDKGEPDEAKIAKKIAAFAPADDGKGKKQVAATQPPRNLGQGNYAGSKPSAKDIAAAEIKRRFPAPANT